jgi:UrcA family protein
MTKTIATLALLLAAAIPANAQAQQGHPATVRVSTADLNLSSPAGVAALDRRIDRAIDTVCPASQSGDFTEKLAVKNCRNATAANVALQREQALASRSTVVTVASVR